MTINRLRSLLIVVPVLGCHVRLILLGLTPENAGLHALCRIAVVLMGAAPVLQVAGATKEALQRLVCMLLLDCLFLCYGISEFVAGTGKQSLKSTDLSNSLRCKNYSIQIWNLTDSRPSITACYITCEIDLCMIAVSGLSIDGEPKCLHPAAGRLSIYYRLRLKRSNKQPSSLCIHPYCVK